MIQLTRKLLARFEGASTAVNPPPGPIKPSRPPDSVARSAAGPAATHSAARPSRRSVRHPR